MQLIDKKRLCKQIHQIYPEIGECGVDVDIQYDRLKGAWIVRLEHAGRRHYKHLETQDALECLEGERCVTLGMQIGQLIANAKRNNTNQPVEP